MKKHIYYAVFALFATISFASCKKDFTCTCTDKTTGEQIVTSIPDSRRPEASTICKASGVYSSDVSCKLSK